MGRSGLRGGPSLLLSLTFVLGALSLVACDVSFGPQMKQSDEEVVSLSVSSGATLRKGDLIDVTIALPASRESGGGSTGDGSSPDQTEEPYVVEMVLESTAGAPVSETRVPFVAGEALPPLTLDDLGLQSQGYRLSVRLLRGEEIIGESRVEFYFVGEEYQLQELTSDGPIVHPGSTVELTALLGVPEGSDPLLEWSSTSGVFARGNLTQGFERVRWTAPSAEGIYTITVALYPLGLPEASVSLSTDVYVAAVSSPLGELTPAQSYLGLFHLMGDLSDAGTAALHASFLPGSPLHLVTRDKIVGYWLDGTGGFSAPGLLLPIRSGELEPMTVNIGFTPAEPPLQGSLVEFSTNDGRFLLRIGFESGDDLLVAELKLQGQTSRIEADASALRAERRSAISFSLFPEPGEGEAPSPGTRAALFIDGATVAAALWPVSPRIPDARGQAVAGGPASAVGLLDELGVFVRDESGRAAPDPDIFARALRSESTGEVYGDGFDGLYPGGKLGIEGDARVARGAAEIGPAGSVRFPALRVTGAGSEVRLQLLEPLAPSSMLRLLPAPDGGAGTEPVLELSGSGALTAGGVTTTYRFVTPLLLTLSLRPEGEGLQVRIDALQRDGEDAAVVSLPAGGDIPAFVLELSQPDGASSALVVDSIAIVTAP